MANHEPKEGSGVLFVNEKKTSGNAPDYTGNILLGCEKKRIAAWVKKGNSGKDFFSLQVSEFQQQAEKPDIPF